MKYYKLILLNWHLKGFDAVIKTGKKKVIYEHNCYVSKNSVKNNNTKLHHK